MDDLTELLNRLSGEPNVPADQLLPLVYQELRRLAARKMAREAPGHTLQATALVHEAGSGLAVKARDGKAAPTFSGQRPRRCAGS